MWFSFSAGQVQDPVGLVLADGAHSEAPKLRKVRSVQRSPESRDDEGTELIDQNAKCAIVHSQT